MYSFFEKINVFNNILYDDKYHKYTIDGKPTVSVTKVTGSIKPPFDEIAKSESTAARMTAEGNPITAEEVRAQWKRNNLISTEKGSAVHKYIESAMANKFERYPSDHIRAVFGATEADPVIHAYNKIISHVTKFVNDIKGRMYPVKSEVVIGSPKYLVCGMIDQIFYNTKSGKFELWDWKTNTKFDTDSKYKLLYPCEHLRQSKLDEYSLQLACYKKMFQEMTGIELGNSYLCWFSEANDTYKTFKCKDLEKEAEYLLTHAGELIQPKAINPVKEI